MTEFKKSVEYVGSTGQMSWLFNKRIEIICVGMCDGYVLLEIVDTENHVNSQEKMFCSRAKIGY